MSERRGSIVCLKRVRGGADDGFTLLELILATIVLVLVIGSVYTTMNVGIYALKSGERNLDLYQNARIGLARVQHELRNAISPESQWKPGNDYIEDAAVEAMDYGMLVQEEDMGEIVFRGNESEVFFSRKMYSRLEALERSESSTKETGLDIQECRFFFDQKRRQIRLEIVRHLTEVRRAEWHWAQQYHLDLSGIVAHGDNLSERARYRRVNPEFDFLLDELVGDVGWDGAQFAYVTDVKEFKLGYLGEGGWVNTWESRTLVREAIPGKSLDDPDFNITTDLIKRELGMPSAVSIALVMANDEHLVVLADIPSSSRNMLGAKAHLRGIIGKPATSKPPAQPGSDRPAGGDGVQNPPVNLPPILGGGRNETQTAGP